MRKLLYLSLFTLLVMAGCGEQKTSTVSSFADKTYLQDTMTRVTLPHGKPVNIVKLVRTSEGIAAIGAEKESYLYQGNQWKSYPTEEKCFTAIQQGEAFWVGSIGYFFNYMGSKKVMLPAKTDTVTTLFVSKNQLFVGTSNGLYKYDGKQLEELEAFKNCAIRQITEDADKALWAATNNGLFQEIDQKYMNLNDYIVANSLDREYFSVAPAAKENAVLYGHKFTFGQISANGNHWVESGATGLPYGPVKAITHSGEDIWMGTDRGVIKKTDKWHYYAGKRWLDNDTVNDLLRIDDKTIWVATKGGINEIKQIPMTLEKKAEIFESRLNERHLFHNFAAHCYFEDPYDFTKFSHHPNDNDGLWSAVYLASECFRYAVTKSPQAKANAERTFLAMEKLETITPIKGFPARSYTKIDLPNDNHGEWHPTPDSLWQWKGDTSSDEIVGHMFAYPLFYELVAEGEMKERVVSLVDRIMSHIVDNGYYLMDLDGKPTRWGVWAPEKLNDDPVWWYERGINSLQILSFLESAYFVTQNEKYTTAYNELIEKHHYDKNMALAKMYGPFEINHSDDELAFFPYYCLMRYARNKEHFNTFSKSLERSWKVEQHDRIPIWNIIASAGLNRDCDLDVAMEEMRDIPFDTRVWLMENSHRWDLRLDPIPDRFKKLQSVTVIPSPERSVTKWNYNTFQLDNGASGTVEDDGAFYLLPYWMGRFHGFLQ